MINRKKEILHEIRVRERGVWLGLDNLLLDVTPPNDWVSIPKTALGATSPFQPGP